MISFPVQVLLFTAISVVIVVMGAFYAERDDGRALRSIPRRLAVFLLSCAAVAVVMLIVEATFASV